MKATALSSLLLAAFMFAAAACGDGADRPAAATTLTAVPGEPVKVAPGAQPTPTNAPLPTPRAARDADIVLTIAGKTKSMTFTFADWRLLPAVEITAGGARKSGVSLAALAAKLGSDAGTIVTVEGRSADLARSGIWRGKLSDFGTTAVLVIDDRGVIQLAGSGIPQEQWVNAVTGVSFQ